MISEFMLADDMAKYYADPLGWVMYAFPWNEPGSMLEGFEGPDEWQVSILIQLGEEIRKRGFTGVEPVDVIKFATASGHGIGKSALTSMVILFVMSTRPHSKGIVTANTGEQLKTKTWAELAKWKRMCITGHWFELTAKSISHIKYSETWRVDSQTCREENSEAFAGLHCADSTPWYIFDEASAVPDKIWEVAEGGLTDGEPMFFVFGNPTWNTGRFADCFGRMSHRWITRQIDSRTAKMTNKRQIQKWLDDHGEDSDFFRVRVRGVFPRAGDMQFIDGDSVYSAMKRGPGQYLGDDPLIMAVDVARGGDDDCRVGFRRGFDAKSERSYRMSGEKSRDSMLFVSKLTMIFDRHKPDICFLDATGIGGPIGDRLRQLGYPVVDVHFGGKADDETKYKNKTAEMGDRFRRWLLDGGSIPDDQDLDFEITSREFSHDDKDRLVLERKEEVKARIGKSPDWADQMYLLFAQAVPKKEIPRGDMDFVYHARDKALEDYDPLDAMD